MRYKHQGCIIRDTLRLECQSPICWTKIGVVELLALTLHRETTKKIIRISNKILAASNHYQSYAEVRICFGKQGKPDPRYIGCFKILDKVGTVAYRLELLKQFSRVHSTFHMSNLKKCLSDETIAIPLDEIQIDDKLHFVEEPVEIIDREVKRLKKSRILIVKVQWNSRKGPEFTWEREDQFWKKYPHLFSKICNCTAYHDLSFADKAHLTGKGCHTP
nr:putative reverse transcriptase domain-containing protein [Tanacetum cinerariifolium]